MASPSLPEATIYYRYGVGRPVGGDAQEFEPFTLPSLGYVKIEFDAYDIQDSQTPLDQRQTKMLTWYGVVGQFSDKTDGGSVQFDDRTVPSGYQQFRCVGLEWLLDRHYILDAQVNNQTVKHAPRFSSNRSGDQFANNMDQATAGDTWSTRQVANYLLKNQVTRGQSGLPVINWELSNQQLLPDFDRQNFEQHGFTTGSILRRLIARQRGYSWFVTVDEATNSARLTVFTFTDRDINLGGSGSQNQLLKNPIGDFDLALNVDRTGNALFISDSFARYDRVRVIGSRATLTFTATPERVADTSGLTDEAAEIVGDGTAEERTENLVRFLSDPAIEAKARIHKVDFADASPMRPGTNFITGEATEEPDNTYYTDKTILARTALQIGEDYDATAFPDTPPPREEPTFYDSPFWLVRREDRWYDTRFIGTGLRNEFDWTASITPAPTFLTFDLNSRNVVLTAIDTSRFESEIAAINGSVPWDLAESKVTATIELDHYCEVVESVSDDENLPELIREKIIVVGGGGHRLDYLAAQTAVGVNDDGTLKTHSDRTIIRDDRDDLRPIANLALAWYGTDRQSVKFSSKHINGNLTLGAMVLNVVDNETTHTINSPVTSIGLSSPVGGGRPQPPTLSYQTSFTELDILS